MRRFNFFTRFEKEEKWLESMARSGYQLHSAGFGYQFHPIPPQEVTIRIDYRQFNNKQAFMEYRTLFEDSGWKHLAGTKYSGTQYFQKVNPHSTDDIFSDASSRAGRYKRLGDMWFAIAVFYLPFIFIGFLTGDLMPYYFFNPRSWFLTPGLWELHGMEFARPFLFELPLALGRGLWGVAMAAILCIAVIFWIKARLHTAMSPQG